MATNARYQNNDLRRQVGSPKPKGRENKETLCRNVLIYGHCRFADQGCTFNHDTNKGRGNQNDLSKKALNVDSPTFTPATTASPSAPKKLAGGLSTQAANAPTFTPRGLGAATPSGSSEADAGSFNPAAIREFTPGFDVNSTVAANGTAQDGAVSYDPFTMATVNQSLPATPFNPYAEEHAAALGGAGSAFFANQGAFAPPLQPLQHHHYANPGPRREDLHSYQRTTSDFFMPENIREDAAKKAEATLQVMPNSQLPQLDNYHSLVPLDTTHRKNPSIFGFSSWVYKASSLKKGRNFCLRRLEGFRLSNESAIRSVAEWRRVTCANVVRIHDAFTTRAFGDSSLIFVQDYHPLSKTLAEVHLTPAPAQGNRFQPKTTIAEKQLWSYITQITTALKAIHTAGLAARCLDPSKVIVTEKHRIRLSACSILDVVNFDQRRPVQELQQEDLLSFGRLILGLTNLTHPAHISNLKAAVDQVGRAYTNEIKETIIWLMTPAPPGATKTIDDFIRGIPTHFVTSFDESQQKEDETQSHVYAELENGRIARLMMKLSAINERPEHNGDPAWSENGERYILKLFRDYVFHQVDRDGNPVLDPGHMLRCLNKLDVGTDERISLTSRDDQTSFIVSYRELKKQLGAAFGELQKPNKGKSL